jgi:LytR cell envelope-related transcriptional attenuator
VAAQRANPVPAVDNPLTTFDAVRPWRTATLVAVAVAAVELILLLVLAGTLFARSSTAAATPARHHPTRLVAARPAARRHASPAATLARRQVTVLILNGNGRRGAASVAAARVHARGYRIAAVGNAARMDYTRSIVMYRPGYQAEGRRLGRDLGVSIVGPLDGMRTGQLDGAKAVLVVG